MRRTLIVLTSAVLIALFLQACSGGPLMYRTPTPVPQPTTQPEGAYPAAPSEGQPETYPAPLEEATAFPSTETVAPTATPLPPTPTIPRPPQAQNASQLPNGADFTWTGIVSGLQRPTDLVDLGGGRMLVLEQPGSVRLIANGTLAASPYLDIIDRVGSAANEQGLLGMALHPRFAENGLFYLNYTDQNGDTVIARYQAAGADSADRASEKILLTIAQPFPNHNGGALAFGPDGYLYIGMGDGGSAGDPQGHGQNLDSLLGKILRIDVDNGDPYAIPPDNPFADGQQGRAEIWAVGLRNPWRISFDRATGDLFIADVGQNQWEEINFQPSGAAGGANYGWNYREGSSTYSAEPPAGVSLVDPVAEYQHPEGCSVTGGFVYRGSELPEFQGVYLYGDYCNGRVWGLLRLPDGSWSNQLLFSASPYISSFGQDQAGEVYLLEQGSGSVLKLVRK